MADFNKFQQFAEDLGKGVHHLHAAGHTLKVYLTNNSPSAADDAVKADLAGITEENGYAAADIQNDYTETSGTGTIDRCGCRMDSIRSSGAFSVCCSVQRHAVFGCLNRMVGLWFSVSLANGEKFKVDFGASVFTIT